MADKPQKPAPAPPIRRAPAFDEKPKPLPEERIRKYDPMISDTYNPPSKPPKKP
jgi:hypothetical protein